MIILRRNTERRYIRSGSSELWLTFFPPENADTPIEGFGAIAILNEYMLQSNECILSELVHQTELVTYMHNGALALEGPAEHSGVITAGEFQCMTIVSVLSQRVTNTSRTDPAHFYRLYLNVQSQRSVTDYLEVQTRFTTAQRRNVLRVVASPDQRHASLRLVSDTCVYSSILDTGQHIVYELPKERKVWLQIVCGKVTANEVELTGGDGMGITDEPSLSLTARDYTELLLVDTR